MAHIRWLVVPPGCALSICNNDAGHLLGVTFCRWLEDSRNFSNGHSLDPRIHIPLTHTIGKRPRQSWCMGIAHCFLLGISTTRNTHICEVVGICLSNGLLYHYTWDRWSLGTFVLFHVVFGILGNFFCLSWPFLLFFGLKLTWTFVYCHHMTVHW